MHHLRDPGERIFLDENKQRVLAIGIFSHGALCVEVKGVDQSENVSILAGSFLIDETNAVVSKSL